MSTADAIPEVNDAAWINARMRAASAGAALSTALAYLGQALSLITIPLYLKYLGQEQYGLMLLLVTLQTYLGQTNLGLNWAAMNMIGAARAHNEPREFVVVVQNALLLGIVTAGVAFAASIVVAFASQFGAAEALRLDDGVNPWAIVAVGGLAAMSLAGGPVYLTFVGMGESSTAALYQGLGRVVAIPAMLAVAWSGGGIAQMLAVNVLILALFLLVGAIHMLRRFPSILQSGLHFSGAHCKRQLKMGLKNMSAELGFLLHATAPTLAIGLTCGAAAVPLYAVPKSLLDTALTFGRSQYSVLQPAYAEAARHGRAGLLARMLASSFKRNLTLLGILCAGFIVLCDPFVRLWTGGRLEISRATAVAVTVGAAATFLTQMFQLFLVAIDRQLAATRILAITGAVSLIAAIFLGWLGGFSAVVSATAIVGTGTAVVMAFAACRHAHLSAPLHRGLKFGGRIAGLSTIVILLGALCFDATEKAAGQAGAIVAVGAGMLVIYLAGARLLRRHAKVSAENGCHSAPLQS